MSSLEDVQAVAVEETTRQELVVEVGVHDMLQIEEQFHIRDAAESVVVCTRHSWRQ